jgi:magnesium-transporting ATPase (P-type)
VPAWRKLLAQFADALIYLLLVAIVIAVIVIANAVLGFVQERKAEHAAGLRVLVVHVPLLNRAFATTPLSVGDWALCAAMASVVLWVDELKKLLLRRTSRRRWRSGAK